MLVYLLSGRACNSGLSLVTPLYELATYTVLLMYSVKGTAAAEDMALNLKLEEFVDEALSRNKGAVRIDDGPSTRTMESLRLIYVVQTLPYVRHGERSFTVSLRLFRV